MLGNGAKMNNDPVRLIKMKRPACHRWALGIFGFVTFGFIVVMVAAIKTATVGNTLKFPDILAIFVLSSITFLGLIVAGRKKWAYYLGSFCLAIWCIRGVQNSYFYLAHWKTIGSKGVNGSQFPLTYGIMIPALTIACLFLFWRFTFGHASRSYYRASDGNTGDAQPAAGGYSPEDGRKGHR